MKKNTSFNLLLCFLFLTTFNIGCTRVFTSIYGMNNPKKMSEEEIYRSADKQNIPVEDCYELDYSFLNYIFSLDSSKHARSTQNHFQSLKVIYYNREGNMQSFHVNCYTGGFPNLKWNKGGIFDMFIPSQQAPLDSVLPLSKHLTYLRPLSKTKSFSPGDYDFVVLVFWSRHMGRQSKRFIELIQKNLQLANTKKVKVLYVNNDNVEAKTMTK